MFDKDLNVKKAAELKQEGRRVLDLMQVKNCFKMNFLLLKTIFFKKPH
jgi:hypothetical protein